MVVHGKIHTLRARVRTHFVKAFGYNFPLFIRIIRFFVKYGFIQTALNGVALLGRAHNLGAEFTEHIAVLFERLNRFFIRL